METDIYLDNPTPISRYTHSQLAHMYKRCTKTMAKELNLIPALCRKVGQRSYVQREVMIIFAHLGNPNAGKYP